MRKYLATFLISFLAVACDIAENGEIAPENRFSRIFDNNEFDRAYYVQDVKQTADGGYLLLGSTNIESSSFLGVYLMKLDAAGNFMWDFTSTEYVNPVSEILERNGQDFVVAMTANNPAAQLLEVGEQTLTVQGGALDPLGDYPLAAAVTSDNQVLVLGYNRDNRRTRLYKTGNDEAWEYDVFEDTNPERSGGILYNHLTRQIQPLPFFVGEVGGSYYFNGFNNFNIALTFANATSGEQTGVLNGVRYDAALSALEPLEGNTFAISRYEVDGENIIAPRADIDPNLEPNDVATIQGFDFPELTRNARVVIRRGIVNNRPVLLYLSDTKNGQIKLAAFDEASGLFLNSRFFGEGNDFEIGGMSLTSDGGAVIVGRTFVAGRFPRICIFKIDEEELNALVP